MSLADSVLSLIRRGHQPVQTGAVLSVSAPLGRCTVMISGAPVEGLPWLGATPSVGDRVMVVGGIVRGTLSPDASPPGPQVTVPIPPAEAVDFQYRRTVTNEERRFWTQPRTAADLNPSWPTWDVVQGAFMSASPAFPGYSRYWTLVRYPNLGASIPAGASDVLVRLQLDRNFELVSNRAIKTVSPVVQGIDYDPLPDLSNPSLPPTNPEPTFVPGFADWRPGPLAPGEVASFEVPPDWVAALRDGTLTGLAFTGHDTADEAWFRSGAAPYRNAHLMLTYTAAPEV